MLVQAPRFPYRQTTKNRKRCPACSKLVADGESVVLIRRPANAPVGQPYRKSALIFHEACHARTLQEARRCRD